MYHITDYTKQRAKEAKVEVRPSTNPKKKIDVFYKGEKVGSVGATGYGDYPTFLKEKGEAYAEKRRSLYHKRHTKDSLGELLALHLLW
jgi:hypothetical protein